MTGSSSEIRVTYQLTFASSCKDILPSVVQTKCPRNALREIARRKRMGMRVARIEQLVGRYSERISVNRLHLHGHGIVGSVPRDSL